MAKTLAKFTAASPSGTHPQVEIARMAKALRYMADKELSKEMRLATRFSVDALKDAIIEEAPVDRGIIKANRLRLSGAIKSRATRTIGRVFINSRYAWYVERGHLTRNQRSRVPGRHFIRTGISKGMSKAIWRYYDGQRKVAEKFNKKHAGKKSPDFRYDKSSGQIVREQITVEAISL